MKVSKKLTTVLVLSVLVVLADAFNMYLEPQTYEFVRWVLMSYVFGQSAVDFATNLKKPNSH